MYGGIYAATVTVTDDEGASVASTTMVVIVGVGMNDGVLYIIGTMQPDIVSVWTPDSGHLRVDGSYLPGNPRTYALAEIQRMVALLCDGGDAMSVGGSVRIPARIDGGAGNDSIVGGGGPSILLGGLGNDSITGGRGRNVIIGGMGADRLVGGAGSDLLISGRTSFDNDDAALMAILAEWTSPRSFAERVANLEGGLGPILSVAGIKLKKSQTVLDDAEVDTLVGAADLDRTKSGPRPTAPPRRAWRTSDGCLRRNEVLRCHSVTRGLDRTEAPLAH